MAKLRNGPMVTYESNGLTVECTINDLVAMRSDLAKARAEERFPKTTASPFDNGAIIEDFMRLDLLTKVRGSAPREEWCKMPEVIELSIEIAQAIQTRDKLAAGKSEKQRVKAHVDNMMSGVGAEAKLYDIVKHAVTYAIKNGANDQHAAVAGQNMAQLLDGMRGVIKEMAGQGAHNINGANVEAVLEDIFGVIDLALSGHTEEMDGQLNTVNGQIEHLGAIGHHVDAIDNHVHSLGNNISAFGALLNSTNGNVVSMTTQISLFQSIVNMLPRMVAEAIQEILPEALENGFNPLMEAITAQVGVGLPGVHKGPKIGKTKKLLRFIKSGLGFFKKTASRSDTQLA